MPAIAIRNLTMPTNERRIPNAVLGIVIFIAAEVMFFAGLISSQIVLRAGETQWPPILQPRLPVAATAINTAILLLSGVALFLSARAQAHPFRVRQAMRLLNAAFVLGAVFVAIQGAEWVRLVGFGLTVSSSLYGALFYIIVGSHAVHVAAGLCVLGFARWKVASRQMSADGFRAARLFWYFVVGIWPVIYVLVYLV